MDVLLLPGGVIGALKLPYPTPKALAPLVNSGFYSSSAGLEAKAVTSLVFQSSMVASVEVIFLLELPPPSPA
jgi:hypothetical protein